MHCQLLLLAAVLAAVGCSKPTTLNQPPVTVSGRVAKAGQPVGNVMISFHPLDDGHPRSFAVKPNGTFAGELISGSYAYYVEKTPAANSSVAMKKVDPKYYAPDVTRSVVVQSGEELLIALD